jgi:uncharacterized membrane protein
MIWYLLILFSVFLNSLAQLFMRLGMKNRQFDIGNIFNLLPQLFCDKYLILSILSYSLSIIFWMIALSKFEISFAVPFQSLGFIFVCLLGYFYMNETLSFIRMFGILFILIGLIFISKS